LLITECSVHLSGEGLANIGPIPFFKTSLSWSPFGPAPNLNLSNLAEVDLSDSNSFIREGLPDV
jgi:hypothetical protein